MPVAEITRLVHILVVGPSPHLLVVICPNHACALNIIATLVRLATDNGLCALALRLALDSPPYNAEAGTAMRAP